VVTSPGGLGPENDCAGEDQQQLYATEKCSRQRGCYIRTMKASIQFKKMLVVSFEGLVAKKS
jgi:hypothetical protein